MSGSSEMKAGGLGAISLVRRDHLLGQPAFFAVFAAFGIINVQISGWTHFVRIIPLCLRHGRKASYTSATHTTHPVDSATIRLNGRI
jgi:hypothetical protein